MKKPIMIAAVVACIAAAVIITLVSRSGETGIKSVPRGELTWLKCRNPDCETEYQMDKRDYFEAIEKEVRKHPMLMATPPLVCEKCSEEGVYRAEKCPECGLVFERGSMGAQNFADRCPECNYSQTEENRRKAVARRRGEE